ncbi:Epoxide hydrolase 4 [Daphnia sinensis]|uniref:Epoxide hydrolase 4 n=1 Tax=Daphnia sinensis TaxID=1820382 RepID=A0AAD5KQU0_9CRUS|nr:Epoxide hydrolase 4 [Daphnia sinensis]
MNVKQLCGFFLPILKITIISIWRRLLNRLNIPTVKIDRQLFTLLFALLVGYNLALVQLCILLWAWLTSKDRLHFWKPKERSSPPTCLVSSSLGRHCYVQLQGIRLHYVEVGDRKKPMLLCLHGFAETWYSWKHQLRAFSKTHWVIAVDMRGYGDSDKPLRTDEYDLRIVIEDIRQLISKLGKETCVLMGHGWGAGIGWFFAAIHPNMLTHFIALSCPHPTTLKYNLVHSWRRPFILRDLFFFQARWIPELVLQSQDNLVIERLAKVGCTTREDGFQEEEAYKYYFGKPDAWRGPLNYYRRMFHPGSLMWMSKPQLRVRVPTLLVFGKKEPNFCRSMISSCSENVDRFDIHVIESASHWVQKETPDKVNVILARFLNVNL